MLPQLSSSASSQESSSSQDSSSSQEPSAPAFIMNHMSDNMTAHELNVTVAKNGRIVKNNDIVKDLGNNETKQQKQQPISSASPSSSSSSPSSSGLSWFKQALSNFLSEPLVEIANGLLVLLSSLLVAISTLNNLSPRIAEPIQVAQDWIAGLFVIEFILRWIAWNASISTSGSSTGRSSTTTTTISGSTSDSTAGSRADSSTAAGAVATATIQPPKRTPLQQTYLAQPLVLVDVFVVLIPFVVSIASKLVDSFLPPWLTSSSALINLRLLRILRLQRVLVDQKTFSRFERALGIPKSNIKDWQLQLARVVLSIFTLLQVATGLIYTAEHNVNPAITDYFTALYFGLTTLTTVGFGDITPITWQGRLVVSLSILAGVAVVPAQGGALVEALLERQRETDNNKKQQAQQKQLKSTSSTSTGATSATAATATTSTSTSAAPPKMTLEVTLACPTCGSVMHWSSARYCWSCGNRLYNDSDKEDTQYKGNHENCVNQPRDNDDHDDHLP